MRKGLTKKGFTEIVEKTPDKIVVKKRITKPSKCSKELIDRICLFLENGNTFFDSCTLAGIKDKTVYDWLQQARGEIPKKKTIPNEMYEYLEREIGLAKSKAAAFHVRNIMESSKTQWTASAWWLERMRSSDFGRKDVVQVEGNPSKPIEISVMKELSTSELEKIAGF